MSGQDSTESERSGIRSAVFRPGGRGGRARVILLPANLQHRYRGAACSYSPLLPRRTPAATQRDRFAETARDVAGGAMQGH